MKIRSKFSKLNQKGVLHILPVIIIVLAVAIAGTFYLVSSKAEQANSKPPSNTFLLYSAGGKYRSITIYTYDNNVGRCGKSDINNNQSATYKFKKKHGKWMPIVINCYYISSNTGYSKDRTLYTFNFNKDSKHIASSVINSEVSRFSPNNCVYAHDYGITKVVNRKNGEKSPCNSQSDEDLVIKTDSLLMVNAFTIKNYQVDYGYQFGLKPKNLPANKVYEDASKQECQGYVSTRFLKNGSDVATRNTARLKYDSSTKSCSAPSGNYKFQAYPGKTPKDYKVTVEVKFSGNKYVNGYTHDLFVRDIR